MRLALALTFAIAAAVLASGQQPSELVALRGRVVDATTGAPVPGAAISAYRHNSSDESRKARTDTEGAFTLTGLVAGEYGISATKPGYLDSEHGRKRPGGSGAPVTVNAGSPPAPITILMWRSGSISGRVLDERGRAAVQVPVHAISVGAAGRGLGYGGSASTNDLGEYFISRLAPGRYIVVVPVRFETRRVNPKVSKWDEAPRGGTSIILDDAGGTALTLGTVMTPYGGLLPPAPVDGRRFFYISSYHGGATRADDARVLEIGSGTDLEGIDVDLQLRPVVRVSGTVVGPAGPVPGAMITLRPLDWGDSSPWNNVIAFAADDGQFAFMAVPEGRYELRAIRKRPTPGMVSLGSNGSTGLPMDDVIMVDEENLRYETSLVVGSDDVKNLAITMTSGTTINGRVTFADEAVLNDRQFANFTVSLVDLTSRDQFENGPYGQASRPDADGVVRFTMHAHPGKYSIGFSRGPDGWWLESARIEGAESGIGPFSIGTRPVNMDVAFTRTPTRVSGTIADTNGGSVPGASVVVFPADEALWPVLDARQMSFDRSLLRMLRPSTGTYELVGLPPAEYFIAAADEALMEGWPSVVTLQRLRELATRITLSPREQLVQPLVVKAPR